VGTWTEENAKDLLIAWRDREKLTRELADAHAVSVSEKDGRRKAEKRARLVEVWQREYDSACSREDDLRAALTTALDHILDLCAMMTSWGREEDGIPEDSWTTGPDRFEAARAFLANHRPDKGDDIP
jgi:hypothetical protein